MLHKYYNSKRDRTSMKLVLPVAGKGKRLNPYTLVLPKCLLPVAGKPILNWIIESTENLPITETLFITGYKSECIETHLQTQNWGQTRIIEQKDPQELAQAIQLCLPYVTDNEPILIILGDTLFKADLNDLQNSDTNILMTLKVENPERFGVAIKNEAGEITKLVEKPKEFISDEALVGLYYIKDVAALKKAINTIISEDKRTKGEYQLTDALQLMIEHGIKFKTKSIDQWLDCGLKETLLETNAILISENDNSNKNQYPDTQVIAPCYIGKGVRITSSQIGPNVAIGDYSTIENCNLQNSIVWENATLKGATHHNDILADEVR